MTSDLKVGTRPEIRSLRERYHKGDLVVTPKNEYNPLDDDPDGEYALVYRQKFDEKGKPEKATLKINSMALLTAFAEAIGAHPQCPFGFDSPFEIEAPFMILFHNWAELEDKKTQTDNDMERVHLGLLLDFMNGELGSLRRSVERMSESNCVEFPTLWTIFKPGELVFSQNDNHQTLLKLDKINYEESHKTGRRFEIHCTEICNDGIALQRAITIFTIYEKQSFAGGSIEKLMSLPVCPLEYLEREENDLFTEFEDRGRRCEHLVGINTMSCNGMAMYQRHPPSDYYSPDEEDYNTTWHPFKEHSRVIIDAKTYLEAFPSDGNKVERTWPQDFIKWAEKRLGSLQRAKYILCSPDVYGYSLGRNEWCKYSVDVLEHISWNQDMIGRLMLPDKNKSILNALVSSHKFPAASVGAFEQKGKGLIILLHGTPGSGKTLTAEVAAEISKSPLLRITLGDLFYHSFFLEALLEEFLKYAVIWKAVVLLDEADVFLERRTSGDNTNAQRNALVAAFLNQLEYFPGIAFLTSNRIDDFDLAMKSRIHLALKYDPPTEDTRRQLWKSQLTAIPKDTIDVDIPKALNALARVEMNGREISNNVNTALTLARHAGGKLELKHLLDVLEVFKEFNEDLKGLAKQRRVTNRQDSLVPYASPVEGKSRWVDPE